MFEMLYFCFLFIYMYVIRFHAYTSLIIHRVLFFFYCCFFYNYMGMVPISNKKNLDTLYTRLLVLLSMAPIIPALRSEKLLLLNVY